jgi:AAA15 family ATPase/GTPase
MFPNIKREKFSHHIYSHMDVPLLKQAAIYGANGSGKSNFIKAATFLREFITRNNFLKLINLEDYIFQLTNKKSQTISFEIEFFHENQYYLYNTGISQNEITEKLAISGLGKTEDQLIFERNGHIVHSPFLQNEDSVKQLLTLNPTSSLLPLNEHFPVLSSKDVRLAYDWFSNKTEIISIDSTVPALINLMSQDSKLLSFTNNVFEHIGIGIKTVDISNIPFDKWVTGTKNATDVQKIIDQKPMSDNQNISQLQNNRNVWNVTMQKGIKTVQEFLFDQMGQSGYHKAMKISAQSDGTVRLLTLIPALYCAMHEGKTIFIDEIDNSIHPNLMFNLLKFYADHDANGQLIFTTHTPKLLNQQELVRPDEVWFAEKTDGNTQMYSLNDFKLHNTLNIENGYLDGRYGGVPMMEELDEITV